MRTEDLLRILVFRLRLLTASGKGSSAALTASGKGSPAALTASGKGSSAAGRNAGNIYNDSEQYAYYLNKIAVQADEMPGQAETAPGQTGKISGQTDGAAAESPLLKARRLWNELCENGLQKPVILFIDAIDQLLPDDALTQSWFIPAKMPENLHLVISSTGKIRISRDVLDNRTGGTPLRWALIPMSKPNEEERREILTIHFQREHKQVSKAVLDRLLAHPLSRNMLCADMMVRWLTSLSQKDFRVIAEREKELGGAGAIESYLLEQIREMPESIPSFITSYLNRIMNFLSEDEAGYAAAFLPLLYISVTSHGLTRSQLERIQDYNRESLGVASDHALKRFWDETVFSKMTAYMGSQLLTRPDGRVDVAHRLIKDALRASRYYSQNSVLTLVYFLFLEDAEDVTRQEDLIPLLLQYLENEKETANESQWNDLVKLAAAGFQAVISDVGSKSEKDDTDPKAAEEGKAQMRRLVFSVIQDLTDRGNPDRRLDCLCDIFRFSVENGNLHYYWLHAFFMDDILRQLNRQTEAARFVGLRYALVLVRSLFEKGKKENFSSWNRKQKYRQLFWMQAVLRLYTDLAADIQKGRYRLRTSQISYEDFLAMCEEYAS